MDENKFEPRVDSTKLDFAYFLVESTTGKVTDEAFLERTIVLAVCHPAWSSLEASEVWDDAKT
eukprot:365969-Chlamydomonas_euryale.AAC.4